LVATCLRGLYFPGRLNILNNTSKMNKGNFSFKTSIPALPLLLLTATGGYAQVEKQPNFLVIMVDDLGWGDLSVNGGKDIRTPNIDKLFSDGVTFTNFYSNSTVCSPTRASLMTGCYPDMAGVPGVIRTHETDSWGYLDPDKPTLPGMLKEGGYQTALIGKWHLGLEAPNLPNQRGFDYFKGFLGDMMDNYFNHLRFNINYMRLNDQEIEAEGHATDVFSAWATDYLEDHHQSEKPFFLFLSYNAPHFPIQPPDDWYLKVLAREKGIDSLRAKNVAFVEHLDAGIGQVMKTLKATGLDRNTVVLFTSDNGGHLPSRASNGILRGGKQDMYEGGIKVPTCMVWPGRIEPGSSAPVLGLTMDLVPTFLGMAGVGLKHDVDGISLWASIKRAPIKDAPTTDDADRAVFWMRREGGGYGGLCYYAARKGPYKLVQNTPWEPLQYFNMDADPLEKEPLSGNTPEFRELRNLLMQHIRRSGSVAWQK
jgi:arylsulfatase A-like enzyme